MSESSAFGSIVVCMSSVSLSEEGPQKLQQQLQENEKKRKNIQDLFGFIKLFMECAS